MQFHLVAFNPDLFYAWRAAFADCDDVRISEGNILSLQADAIVSPANSFGYMDGGLDLKLSEFFGWDLEKRLQAELVAEHGGELPVGQAVIVETHHIAIKYLISAPTMRVPMRVADTTNAYLAFRAVIRAVQAFNQTAGEPILSLLCPGLGTGEGRMPAKRCATQMRAAYDRCLHQPSAIQGGLAHAVREHMRLMA
jgi:O-acetyl-ADP-ribose deacetylase (regulator of RNase III)